MTLTSETAPHATRHRSTSVLPTSKSGRVAAWVFLAAVLMIVVNAVVVESVTLGMDPRPPLASAYVIATALTLFASGALGLVAIVRDHERGVLVLVPTAVALLVLGNEIVQGLMLP